MRKIITFFGFAVAGAIVCVAETSSANNVSCACEDIKCAPCEIEQGTTFYTEKCGPGLSRVKSCQKRTCVKPASFEQCMSELGRESENAKKQAAVSKTVEAPGYIGEVMRLEGAPKRIHAKGTDILKMKSKVYSGDKIETGANDRVTIALDPGRKFSKNEIVIDASTSITVAEAVGQISKEKTNTLIHLMRGRLRTKVNNKVDGQASTFRVETKTAVAGVRGTDFVTSFEPKGSEWVTTVQTLEGRVHVGRLNEKPERDPNAQVVTSAQEISFTTAIPENESSKDNVVAVVARGAFSGIKAIEKPDLIRNQMRLINEAAEAPVEIRKPSSVGDEPICDGPPGTFNQCSFECVGGKSGDAKCRTDRPGVACMRRICRANGKWLEPTKLPSNQSAECPPTGISVRSCNQYW